MLTAPTAAGKSALALRVATELGAEIIAADAFTVYRGLDIGTAKPGAAERARVPHHLLDVADVTEPYDVARFVAGAEAAIAGVLRRGRVPLVVGGTGFYLSALRRGLPLTPPSDPARRAEVEEDLCVRGLDALLAEIAARNPAEAARMERNPRRVVRALEVWRATGRFPGEFGHRPPAYDFVPIAFDRPEGEWQGRARTRIAAMFAAGWPAEAAWLAAQVRPGGQPRPTVWQALGYPEALAVAHAELDPLQAQERVLAATRGYARRQRTFIRTQLGAALLTPEGAEAALRAATLAARVNLPASGRGREVE